MPTQDPDLDLVRALQAGEDSSLNELIARHQEPLFRFIYRSTGNESDARELTQEVFVKAYFKIKSFRPQAKFSTWLYRIAVNLCRDRARSRHHQNMAKTDSLHSSTSEENQARHHSMADQGGTPFEILSEKERMAKVAELIEELPPELKEALILTAFEDLSHTECALILKTTAKTIEMRVYRARKLLLESLTKSSA